MAIVGATGVVVDVVATVDILFVVVVCKKVKEISNSEGNIFGIFKKLQSPRETILAHNNNCHC